jgi:four helix bundle protein
MNKLSRFFDKCLNFKYIALKKIMPRTARKFEDLNVWKDSRLFVNHIYKLTDELKDFSFKDQIRRAFLSIMNNIAEGFGRRSNADFIRFLNYSNASGLEVKSMLYLALDLGYFSKSDFDELFVRLDVILRMIYNFQKYLKQ